MKIKISWHCIRDETEAVVQVFFVRDGKLIGREHYYMTCAGKNNKPAILQDFVKQFYAGTPFIPRELMLQYEIEDTELIEKWLSERKGSRVYLKVPKIGSKENWWNWRPRMQNWYCLRTGRNWKREGRPYYRCGEGNLRSVAASADRHGRMEAYDISNINGFENVGSMVVYEKGEAQAQRLP